MRRDQTIPRGEVHRLLHKSDVLQGNPLGDPATRELIVWTPPDWKPAESLPILVDLKGYMSSALAHANWSPTSENVPERLDRLASEGMARAVVVLPDCFTKLFGNQYLNSAGSGRYADYICDEIVPLVESKFNCGGKGRRGVFGKSSGGYGAAWHGLHRADFWDAISINSGDMGFDALYIPALLDDLTLLAKHDNSIEKLWTSTLAKKKSSFREQVAMMDFAQSAFYDPDPTQFLNMRLPLDPYTGEFIPERWANWMAHDPVVMFDEKGSELKKLKLIYMDCGDHDNFRIHLGMRRFVKKLKAAGIAHTYEEFDDDHMDVDYRMDVFLPLLARALT
ncbi:MAG: enterochelin esterase [Proteobacteria bacterium]|nr:enterochelin esterase [Pseudomonadota bacterium]